MFLVTGATGNVGGPLVQQLAEQNHDVRALVRAPSRAAHLPAGTELATGDLDDPESLAKAVQGVEAIFLMHVEHSTDQTEAMIAAAKGAGVPRIVLLSSVGARLLPLNGPVPSALAAREQLLRESGLEATYLRPNAFASNALWWRDGIRAGKVTDPYGDGALAVIDPRDIARVAATVLTEPGHAGKGYVLTGPAAMTTRTQIETIADVLGRPVEFQDVTPHEFALAAIEQGTPPEQAHRMERLHEVLRARTQVTVTDDVENVTGVAPGTFRAWCERNADAFR